MHKQSSEGRFCKPKYDAGPTRFLYVSGVGEELHSDVDKLVHFFSHFGPLDNRYVACSARDDDNDDEIDGGVDDGSGDNDGIDVKTGAGYTNKVTLRNAICMIPNRRYIYVCYLSVQSATAALTYIRTQKGLQSNDDDDIFVKKLCANYAEERVNMVSRHTGIQCSSANTAHVDVPGCHLIKDFISIEEEKELLSELAGEDAAWRGDLNRRVQHFGFPFNYRTLMLDYSKPTRPLPMHAQKLSEQILREWNDVCYRRQHHDNQLVEEAASSSSSSSATTPPPPPPLNQLTINEYMPGQGIAAHTDTKSCFGSLVFILNLGSGITMNLTRCRRKEKDYDDNDTRDEGGGGEDSGEYQEDDSSHRKCVFLPVRSLLILSEESRYGWSHGITPRRKDRIPLSEAASTSGVDISRCIVQGDSVLVPRDRRVSLTFRHALRPGQLPPIRLCSSELEMDHVVRVYDNIAVHWNHTRGKRKVHWHKVKDFIDNLPVGTLLADVGSGDGKYFGLNPGILSIGCDRSLKLLEVSHSIDFDTFCCDAVKLPFRSDLFDATLCIAVLHHLSTLDRRFAVISELVRITKPGGTIMIQAWALEQGQDSKRIFESQDTMVPWRLNKRFLLPADSEDADNAVVSGGVSEVKETTKSTGYSTPVMPGDDTTKVASANTDSGDDGNNNQSSIHIHHAAIEQKVEDAVSDASHGPCKHVREEHGDLVFQRYCHVYKQGELEGICSSVPCCRIIESGWDKGNWFIQLEKFDDDRIHAIGCGPESNLPILQSRK